MRSLECLRNEADKPFGILLRRDTRNTFTKKRPFEYILHILAWIELRENIDNTENIDFVLSPTQTASTVAPEDWSIPIVKGGYIFIR